MFRITYDTSNSIRAQHYDKFPRTRTCTRTLFEWTMFLACIDHDGTCNLSLQFGRYPSITGITITGIHQDGVHIYCYHCQTTTIVHSESDRDAQPRSKVLVLHAPQPQPPAPKPTTSAKTIGKIYSTTTCTRSMGLRIVSRHLLYM